jgi:hypothetical protein
MGALPWHAAIAMVSSTSTYRLTERSAGNDAVGNVLHPRNCRWTVQFRESSPIYLSRRRIVSVIKPIEKTYVWVFFVLKYTRHVFIQFPITVPCNTLLRFRSTDLQSNAGLHSDICTYDIVIHRYRPPINSVTDENLTHVRVYVSIFSLTVTSGITPQVVKQPLLKKSNVSMRLKF